MPRKQKHDGIPKQHRLSNHKLWAEGETLKFQKDFNEHDYLSWYDLVRKIDPLRKYEIKSFGFSTETLTGGEILGEFRKNIDARDCTFADSVTEVADDYVTPVEQLWNTVTEPDGTILVENYDQDPWDHSSFTATTPEERRRVTEVYGDEFINDLLEFVREQRMGGYDPSSNFGQVLTGTRDAIINGLAMGITTGLMAEAGIIAAGRRAEEAFDRLSTYPA